MKAFVTGRKNWLFSDSPEGADALAICYSMTEMAKANGLDSSKYLDYLLANQPTSEISLEDFIGCATPKQKVFGGTPGKRLRVCYYQRN